MRDTLRQTRRRAGLLSAAAIALLGAPQVRAQDVGFVWNNNPTTAGTTTPGPAYSFNSSGGAIAITRNAKGNYTVTFTGLGNALNSNVVVSAYGAGPDFCISGGWSSPNGTDVQALYSATTNSAIWPTIALPCFIRLVFTATPPRPPSRFCWPTNLPRLATRRT